MRWQGQRIDETDAQALPQDGSCATGIPRPPAWLPPQLEKNNDKKDPS